MVNRGPRKALEQGGWPLQLLLGRSRAVNRKPRLQLLHGCVTLLARHLKWQLPGGTPERLCVGARSLPSSAMLEGPVTVCAEREHVDGWSGES